jgi:Mn2+/Fe2+ NRAMP family transporter
LPYKEAEVTTTIEVTTAPPGPPWWEQTFFGLPFWVWIVIGVAGATVAGVATYAEEERRKRLLMAVRR